MALVAVLYIFWHVAKYTIFLVHSFWLCLQSVLMWRRLTAQQRAMLAKHKIFTEGDLALRAYEGRLWRIDLDHIDDWPQEP